MSAGFKPEFNAYLTHLVTSGRAPEAQRFVDGVRESSRNPAPVVIGDHELVPTPEVVTRLMEHVFESPPECEMFIRRWFTDARPQVRPDMAIHEQARQLFRCYHPRVVATTLRSFFPDRVVRFVPSAGLSPRGP